MTLLELGQWEYDCLKSDMENQGESFDYKGGFNAWYHEVFLIDEAWAEIRDNHIEYRKSQYA